MPMLRLRVYPLFAPEGAEHAGGAPEHFSREYVQELRQESAQHRIKAAEAQRLAAEAQKSAADTVKAVQERLVRAELKAVAIKAGIVDLDALKLADVARLQLNESGDVEGAEALLDELKASKPYLFAPPQTHSSSTRQAPKPAAPEPLDARTMSAAEYAKARARYRP